MNKIKINQKLKIISWITFVAYLLIFIKLIYFKLPLQAVLMIVTGSEMNYAYSVNLIPLKTIFSYLQGIPLSHIALKNLLGNLILFFPFGFLAPIIFTSINSIKKVLITSIAFSFLLEISQILLHLGSFDIDDIILNTIGALIGYLVSKKIFTLMK